MEHYLWCHLVVMCKFCNSCQVPRLWDGLEGHRMLISGKYRLPRQGNTHLRLSCALPTIPWTEHIFPPPLSQCPHIIAPTSPTSALVNWPLGMNSRESACAGIWNQGGIGLCKNLWNHLGGSGISSSSQNGSYSIEAKGINTLGWGGSRRRLRPQEGMLVWVEADSARVDGSGRTRPESTRKSRKRMGWRLPWKKCSFTLAQWPLGF